MMGRDRQLTITAVEAGPTLEEPELLSLPANDDGDQEFRDRSTGLPLNPEIVKRAREVEMQYMEELKVLEDSDRDACVAETGRPPIPTVWVDINNGDSLRPKLTGSVRKETIAVSDAIKISVQNRHSRTLLRDLLRGRT